MKKLILIFFTLLTASILLGQHSIEYSQSNISIENDHLIIFLDTSKHLVIKIKEVTTSTLGIDITVQSAAGKKGILEYLKKSGRYQLEVYAPPQLYSSVLRIKNKPLDVFINGNKLREVVTYTLHIPKELDYEIRTSSQKETLAIR